ncbi:6-bladed beta-propeller [Balneolaceae bacterium ANBcel3]|nr:6-bladed beta-propeller [Balneolaceae bacterium ANBcel3]
MSCSQDQKEIKSGALEDIAEKVHSIVLSDEIARNIGEISYNSLYCEEHELLILHSRDNRTIFIVDMDGELISMFGGEGRGPDEFLNINSLTKDSEYNILVYDSQNQLFKKFSYAGELINTYQPPSIDKFFLTGEYGVQLGGNYYFSINDSPHAPANEEKAAFIKTDSSFTHFHKYGRIDRYYIEESDDVLMQPSLAYDSYSHNLIITFSLIPYFKVYDIEDDYALVGRYGYQSPNFLMSDTPLTFELLLDEYFRIATEKSWVQAPFVTRDYLVFRFYEFLGEGPISIPIESSDQNFFLKLYDRTNGYEYLTEIDVPSSPIAVDGDRNRLFFVDRFETDEIEIGVYELKSGLNKVLSR